jgi:hypothetical protein
LTLAKLLVCSEKTRLDDVIRAATIEKLAEELEETDINEAEPVKKDPVQMITEGFIYFKTNKFEYGTTR